nr:FtsW/RodA/SpoVE family cell cycle protein [Eubacterium oxidoreducens]
MFKQYKIKYFDFRLVFFAAVLSIIGVLLVGSAKASVQNKQIAGLIMGLIIMVIVSFIDYNQLLKYSWVFYAANFVLLIAVRIFGDDSGGATRWLNIAGIRFQPTELSKIVLILFFAALFLKMKDQINTMKGLLTAVVLLIIPVALVLLQPDLSSSIVIVVIFAAIIFVAGLNYKIVLGFLGIVVPVICISIALLVSGTITVSESHQYQVNRILAWLHPDDYPQLALQTINSIMAIGSGQVFGKGLYNDAIDSVKNGNYISEPQTDFIFAVAGEEIGFVGCTIIIILLFLIVFECIILARKAKDMGGRLICIGVGCWIGFQAFVNIGVTTGLLPNTGVTLPFISYGLTSLISLYIALGIVLNVGMQPKLY